MIILVSVQLESIDWWLYYTYIIQHKTVVTFHFQKLSGLFSYLGPHMGTHGTHYYSRYVIVIVVTVVCDYCH